MLRTDPQAQIFQKSFSSSSIVDLEKGREQLKLIYVAFLRLPPFYCASANMQALELQ